VPYGISNDLIYCQPRKEALLQKAAREGEGNRARLTVQVPLEARQDWQHPVFLESLAQVATRRRFQAYLDQEWERMARVQAPLSLILGEIDFFKAYNDTYGHEAGDKCLQQIAEAIVSAVKRPADIVPHYGAQQFILILPNTNAEDARIVAEEIYSGVKALEMKKEYSEFNQYPTLSLGVSSIIPTPEYSSTILITAAEQALYQAKTQGYDCAVRTAQGNRVILCDLKWLTQVIEAEKTPACQHRSEERNGAAISSELLRSYVAYYLSRGKTVISPICGFLSFEGLVYQYRGYHKNFQSFWKQLQQRRDFRQLYLEGDIYSFGQFLGGSCAVGECARCNLPIPITKGSAYGVPNCPCDKHLILEKAQAEPKPQDVEEELDVNCVLAIGTPPSDYKTLEELFSVNGFEVTFITKPEEVTPQSLPHAVVMVLIYAEVSEAEGQAWARKLRYHSQLQHVPIVALSAEAGHGHSWVERTLGVEDYLLVPLGGDRLAHRLARLLQSQPRSLSNSLLWFPR
jgi:diguanylate cyclase (GGDEF)-like protein